MTETSLHIVALRNTSADSVVFDIPALCGRMKMSPWLKTRQGRSQEFHLGDINCGM